MINDIAFIVKHCQMVKVKKVHVTHRSCHVNQNLWQRKETMTSSIKSITQ